MGAIQSRSADDIGTDRAFPLAQESILDGIRRTAQRLPDKDAVLELVDADPGSAPRRISYGALLPAIVRRANLLRSLGVIPGDAILFLPPQSLDGLLAFWAAHAAGAAAPVNAFLGTAAIAEIATHCAARVIVSGGRGSACGTYDLARAVIAACPGIVHHLVVSGDAGDATDLNAVSATQDDAVLAGGDPALDDIAAYFPTGGTTGAPKVARLSHRNLLTGAMSSALVTSMDEDHVVPAGLPLFHVGGGVIGTTRALLLGHTLVLLTPAGYRSPEIVANFWPLAVRFGFTQIISVPTVFGDLLRGYRGEAHRLTVLTAGASKLPASLVAEYRERLGLGLHEGYGMTECAGFCAVNPADRRPRAGSGGTAAPGYRVRIVRLDDRHRFVADCATGETGTIAIAGDGVFQGYTDAALTAQKLIDGMPGGERWIDAGDLGQVDADGYLWVLGRDKDLIIRGGHNIDPAPIEDALLATPGVLDAAVVGMPDARVGELPVAFVQLGDGVVLDEPALQAACRARIPDRAGVPVRIVPLDVLPRTAMRKIFKPELRRIAAQIAVDALGAGGTVAMDAAGCLTVEIDATPDDMLARAIDRLGLKTVIRELQR